MKCIKTMMEKVEKYLISDVDYEGEELQRLREYYEEKLEHQKNYYESLLSVERQKVAEYTGINTMISDEMRQLETLYSQKVEELQAMQECFEHEDKNFHAIISTYKQHMSRDRRIFQESLSYINKRLNIVTEYAAIITAFSLTELFYLLLN